MMHFFDWIPAFAGMTSLQMVALAFIQLIVQKL